MLIHGIGCQAIHWPSSLIDGLVAQDFRVVFFDNRDVGLSYEVDAPAPSVPDLLAAQFDPSKLTAPYHLADMADDVCRILDHIGASGAHIVGVSMGGMIAQHLAARQPQRVFSLALLMSSSGNPSLPPPQAEAVAALSQTYATNSKQEVIDATIAASQIFAGPHFDSREHGIARFTEIGYERSYRPEGGLRQLAAILADGDRRDTLSSISAPTAILHGTADPLIPYQASEDLALCIDNATLSLLERWGHDLSEPIIPDIVALILSNIRRANTHR